MSETKHSPEPWRRGEEHETKVEIQEAAPPYRLILTVHGTGRLGGCSPDHAVMDANARRIVACVNACAGLDIGGMETESLQDALFALEVLVDDDESVAARRLAIAQGRHALRSLGRLP